MKQVTLTYAGIRLGMRNLGMLGIFLVLPFALAFGAAAVDQGVTALQATVMSATVFAGAAQFAILELWTDPLPIITISLTTLAVNARHLLLGAALAKWLNLVPLPRRLVTLMVMSDANFADTHKNLKDGGTDVGILLGGGIVLWTCWLVGTAAGAYAGNLIGDLSRFGIDVLIGAFFVTITAADTLVPKNRLPIVCAIVIAVISVNALPQGWGTIVAAIVGGAVGAFRDA